VAGEKDFGHAAGAQRANDVVAPQPRRLHHFEFLRNGLAALTLVSTAAVAADSKVQQARSLVQVARAQFDQGEFKKAAELLETAYELAPSPEILFNLGRACERAGLLERAIEALHRYLDAAPKAEDRKAVESTIRDLEQRLDERKQIEALKRASERPPDAPVAEAERPLVAEPLVEKPIVVEALPAPQVRRPRVPWVLAGIGVASLGAGVGLAVAAQDAYTTAMNGKADGADVTLGRAKGFGLGANLAYGLGAALVAAGALWIVIDYFSSR
jgi:tetratricopeptide (TPR) repeat protein